MVREAAIKSFASFSPTACILSRLPYHFYVFSNPALTDILNSTKPHPLLFLIVASPIPTIASTIPVPLGCLPYRKRYAGVFGEILNHEASYRFAMSKVIYIEFCCGNTEEKGVTDA